MKWQIVAAALALWIGWSGLAANAQDQAPTFLTPEEATTDRLIGMLKPLGEKELIPSNSCEVFRPLKKAMAAKGIGTQIPAIQMAYNRSVPDPQGQRVLRRVADALNSSAVNGYCIRIEGHTDSRGSAAYNQKLSERRARSVVNYLEELGVEPERLMAIGYGKTNPMCDEETEKCWEKNRAVRFVTLGG